MQVVLEKAEETLGRQSLGTIGLEAAKVQLSDLVSKVSTQCLNSQFSSGTSELSDLCLQQTQTTQPIECLMDSCLPSCEGPMRDQELYNNLMSLKPKKFRASTETRVNCNEANPHKAEHRWLEDPKDGGKFLSTANGNMESAFMTKTNFSGLTMSIGHQSPEQNSNGKYQEKNSKGAEGVQFFNHNDDRIHLVNPHKRKTSPELKQPISSTKLDLNTDGKNDAPSGYRQLDLNGFSWS